MSKDLADSYKLIQQRFVEKLQDWLPIFKKFEEQIKSGSVKKAEEIRMQMHKLAGSAKTFGFPKLNSEAAKIEHHLNKLIDGEPLADLTAELEKDLSEFLTETQKILSSAKIETPEKKAHTQESPSQKTPQKAKQKSDYHILVADDDDLVRDLLKQGFLNEKCNIVEVDNGKKAIKYLKDSKKDPSQAQPDLLVLDINMPVMNGIEVLKTIKQDRNLKNLPVIILTRNDEDENVIQGISYGALDYITKPFDVETLAQRILSTLKLHNTKILVADDDELICEILQKRFNKMGYSVLICHNGIEALKCAQKDKPDIAILDVMMPGMDGLAVLQQMQKDSSTANIPTIILTAKNQQENILKGLETGAHDYITKPFDIDEIAARVLGILQRSKKT